MLSREAKEKIKRFYNKIDSLNYFQILRVKPDSSDQEIRDNFYKLSKVFHPDRYFTIDDQEVKQMINKIYKQISEAYNILKSPKLKEKYIKQLKEDPSKIRYRFDEEKKVEEKEVTGPAKKYFQLGVKALENKNIKNAKLNFKLALSLDPNSEIIKKKLKEVDELEKKLYSNF